MVIESVQYEIEVVQLKYIANIWNNRIMGIKEANMANREKEIILFFLNNEIVIFDKLVKNLSVSRRTLYYDIAKINSSLDGYGEIVKVGSDYKLIGNFGKIENKILRSANTGFEVYLEYDVRKRKIFIDLFKGKKITVKNLASEMFLSESTITQTVKKLKGELVKNNIRLYFENGYKLSGNEILIRDLYLQINSSYGDIFLVDDRINKFNQQSKMKLTDFSKCALSNFVKFIIIRNLNGNSIQESDLYEDTVNFSFFKFVDVLLGKDSLLREKKYLIAYISTLSSLDEFVEEEKVVRLVKMLIVEIEQKMMVIMKDKNECVRNLSRHLLSSYNRIKYHFPVMNPLTNEIRIKYEYLFRMIKNIFKTTMSLKEFSGIRDEEIAYIVSYIGAYIERDAIGILDRIRVLIVCPNGITVTKTIHYQLEKYFPQIDIVDELSYFDVRKYAVAKYDWIISTIELKDLSNVVVINPILKNNDLAIIGNMLFSNEYQDKKISVSNIIEAFKKYGSIKNESELTSELYSLYFKTRLYKGGNPMLKELITVDKIKIIEKIESWEEAIRLVSKPLLDEGTIEPRYIDAMIDGVNEFGPYIVLVDCFALAHSRPDQGVNELSMSLLKVNKAFDMKGKEVKVVIVLAATDNKKHLRALSSITELFTEKKDIERLMETDSVDTILELIIKYS